MYGGLLKYDVQRRIRWPDCTVLNRAREAYLRGSIHAGPVSLLHNTVTSVTWLETTLVSGGVRLSKYRKLKTLTCNVMFYRPCITVYRYSETNVMHFSFSLLRIKGLYMFRALLAHPQDTLHKWHLVYCMRVMSVGHTRIEAKPQSKVYTTLFDRHIT
jgi:hypothetical protein